MPVYNCRPVASHLSLDEAGFELRPHRSGCRNFYDVREVRENYYPEVASLLEAALGALRVFVFDHNVRSRLRSKRGSLEYEIPWRAPTTTTPSTRGPPGTGDSREELREPPRRASGGPHQRVAPDRRPGPGPPARGVRSAKRGTRRLHVHRNPALSGRRPEDAESHRPNLLLPASPAAPLVLRTGHAAERSAVPQVLRLGRRRACLLHRAHRLPKPRLPEDFVARESIEARTSRSLPEPRPGLHCPPAPTRVDAWPAEAISAADRSG